jgi:hypothetical protein
MVMGWIHGISVEEVMMIPTRTDLKQNKKHTGQMMRDSGCGRLRQRSSSEKKSSVARRWNERSDLTANPVFMRPARSRVQIRAMTCVNG